jgi:hypothetical protein
MECSDAVIASERAPANLSSGIVTKMPVEISWRCTYHWQTLVSGLRRSPDLRGRNDTTQMAGRNGTSLATGTAAGT